jgi:hypothetical protein
MLVREYFRSPIPVATIVNYICKHVHVNLHIYKYRESARESEKERDAETHFHISAWVLQAMTDQQGRR